MGSQVRCITAQPVSPRHALARRIIIDLAAMTVIGVFLAIIGPFGSIGAPIPERLVTWIGFSWLGYACYRPMQSVASWGERKLALPRWGMLAAAVLAGTVPMTVAVLAINTRPFGSLGWPGLDTAMTTYFAVLVIGGAITVLFNLMQAKPREAAALPLPAQIPVTMPAPAVPVQAPPRLRSRLHPIRCWVSCPPNSAATSSRSRWMTTMSASTRRGARRWC